MRRTPTIEAPPPADDRPAVVARLGRRWTAAFVVGEFVGFIPPAVVGATLVWLDAGDAAMVLGLTVAGLFEGTAIGLAQVVVLRRRWPAIDRRGWITATAVAAGLAWFVGMGGSALAAGGVVPAVVAAGLLAPAAVLALLSMGYLQWRVLEKVVPHSGRWVIVTARAWLVGVAVPVVALSVIPNTWPLPAHVVVAVVAAMVMGLIVGWLTGRTLDQFAGAGPVRGSVTGPRTQPDPADSRPQSGDDPPSLAERTILSAKFAWTAASSFLVESIIVGLAALPAIVFYQWHLNLRFGPYPLRLIMLAAAILPAYLLFCVLLMLLSAETTRLLGWRPPRTGDLVISELPIELRNWARYAIASHLVHVVAGAALRSTPLWVWYMRRNGAKIGRHVWINSLQVGDDCLLELGDEVVIGAGVHMSGHTVERGRLRLAPIRIGAGTTIGIGAHVGIGVSTGEQTQIGSMSVVPKHAELSGHTTYAGIPARPIVTSAPSTGLMETGHHEDG